MAAVTFSATLLHQSLVFIFAANILTTLAVSAAKSPSAVLAVKRNKKQKQKTETKYENNEEKRKEKRISKEKREKEL